MRITYDPDVDAAYIYLSETFGDGEATHTYGCDPAEVGGMINLDFDDHGRMLGIEVMDASHHLPEQLLKDAEILKPAPRHTTAKAK
jgi:uncharacterized protein YuzE